MHSPTTQQSAFKEFTELHTAVAETRRVFAFAAPQVASALFSPPPHTQQHAGLGNFSRLSNFVVESAPSLTARTSSRDVFFFNL